MTPCLLTYAHEWWMLTLMMPSLRISPVSFVTSIRDSKFGLPERCYRSHWHNSVFPGYVLSCFFLSLTHIYPLIVGVEVIPTLHHIRWHAHTRQGCSRHGICPSQNTLPQNTHHSQATDINAPCNIETAVPDRRPTPWTMQQAILVGLISCVVCRWYK